MTAVVRTTIICVFLSVFAGLGYWKLTTDIKQRTIDDLRALNADMQARLEQRQMMIDRLSRSRRIAHLMIGSQSMGEGETIEDTNITMIELDEDGAELARQHFTLPGDVIYVDAWTVKFGFEEVAHGHPLFGRSLVLLRRLYSENIAPVEGVEIDLPGAVPPGYATTDAGRFEQQLWRDFWDIATDAEKARSMGVRVAQGEAAYKKVRTGQSYELIVDSAGGMSLTPLEDQSVISLGDTGSD